ncbi:hypothetical protein B0H14DRAFT_3722252 [Mycena olivaceomarginata]|nr:hypothetical protein B0H14DRAFT_3722252 [Mycena olivaceomarginata]
MSSIQESDVPLTPSEQAALPPSPAWGTAVSLSPEPFAPALLARDPSPPPVVAPAPPPVAKLSFKEWQARRKLQRAKEGEVAQEREREREGQREQERERERQRERENKAAQGEDKENKLVPVKAEDGLSRILNDIRRSTVSDKTPQVEQPARQDVEMADVPPLVVAPGAAPALSPVADFQSKLKASPLSMTALVGTGNDHLSPLAVSSSVDSRTPSCTLVNGIKPKTSPFASQTVPSPKSPLLDVIPYPALPQSALTVAGDKSIIDRATAEMSYEELLTLSRRLLTLAPNGESMVSVKPQGSAPVVSIPASPVTSTPVQPKVSLPWKEAVNVLKKKFSFGEIDRTSVSEVPIPDSPIVSMDEGPSKPKGKGADPRNWGNISFGDFTEADFNAQREALANFAEITV